MNLTKYFTSEEFERSQTAARHSIDNSVPEHLMQNMKRTAEHGSVRAVHDGVTFRSRQAIVALS